MCKFALARNAFITKCFADIMHSYFNVSHSRARPAEDLQEKALSDQLAFLERIQHTTGRPAAVAHLAVPNAGAPVWTALKHHLLSRPGSAKACDGEWSTSQTCTSFYLYW